MVPRDHGGVGCSIETDSRSAAAGTLTGMIEGWVGDGGMKGGMSG